MKKTLSSLVVASSLLLIPSLTGNAASDFSGYEYKHYSTTKSKKVEFTHYHTNRGSTTDKVSRKVEITKSTTANVSTKAVFKSLVAEAGVDTQIGLGKKSTKALTITWSVPKKSTYKLVAGSKMVKESGTEKYWQNGRVISSKSVSGKWSYATFSDKIKQ